MQTMAFWQNVAFTPDFSASIGGAFRAPAAGQNAQTKPASQADQV
jgi:hypothetical protein